MNGNSLGATAERLKRYQPKIYTADSWAGLERAVQANFSDYTLEQRGLVAFFTAHQEGCAGPGAAGEVVQKPDGGPDQEGGGDVVAAAVGIGQEGDAGFGGGQVGAPEDEEGGGEEGCFSAVVAPGQTGCDPDQQDGADQIWQPGLGYAQAVELENGSLEQMVNGQGDEVMFFGVEKLGVKVGAEDAFVG